MTDDRSYSTDEIPLVVVANPPKTFLLHHEGETLGWLFVMESGVMAVREDGAEIFRCDSLEDFQRIAPMIGADIAEVVSL